MIQDEPCFFCKEQTYSLEGMIGVSALSELKPTEKKKD